MKTAFIGTYGLIERKNIGDQLEMFADKNELTVNTLISFFNYHQEDFKHGNRQQINQEK